MTVYEPETFWAAVNRATTEALKVLIREAKAGFVNDDNFNEVAEAAIDEVVNNLQLLSGDEVVDSRLLNEILQKVLIHANRQ